MSCCGQSSGQAQAKVIALIDEGADAGALVRLVYVGADKRTLPFVVEGKVYQFGNNERRRVNAVPARVAPTFLRGRWPGLFVTYDPALHSVVDSGPVGSATVELVVPPVGKAKGAK